MLVDFKEEKDKNIANYLEQISNVPLFSNHVVMSFTTPNFSRLAMNENLLNDESHASKAVSISILPDRVVVDFVDAIN